MTTARVLLVAALDLAASRDHARPELHARDPSFSLIAPRDPGTIDR
jgi:hypothetical protein